MFFRKVLVMVVAVVGKLDHYELNEYGMSVQFTIADLIEALDFAGFNDLVEQGAMLDQQSGQVLVWSSEMDFEELNGIPEPDDLYGNPRYIAMPDEQELDLGRPLALEFARQQLPDDADTVASIFRKRGAYRRFKDLLGQRNKLDSWHQFEADAREAAIRDWAESMDISIVDDK